MNRGEKLVSSRFRLRDKTSVRFGLWPDNGAKRWLRRRLGRILGEKLVSTRLRFVSREGQVERL